MGRYNQKLLTPILLLVVTACVFSSSILPGLAIQTQNSIITLDTPTNNQEIFGSSVWFGGTYQEFYSNPNPNIYLSIDNSPNIEVYFGSGTWSYTDSSIGSGWHDAKITISDSSGTFSQETNFIIINGHTTITKYNIILIEYSETCQKLLDSNQSSNCPNLGELKKYDTSNQNLAGKIIFENGIWKRTKPEVKNWWNFVNLGTKPTVCVSCQFDLGNSQLVQLLFIEPGNFTYPNQALNQGATISYQYFNGTGYYTRQVQDPNVARTLTINSNRYVSPDCLSANMEYSPRLVADTIAFFENGCTKTSIDNLTSTIKLHSTPFSFQNRFSTLHYQDLINKIANSGGIGNCINHTLKNKCNYKDPYSNPNW